MAEAQEIIDGLTLLMKHGKVSVDAQHDVIYAGVGIGGELSTEEVSKMVKLGWHFDIEFNCWARFT